MNLLSAEFNNLVVKTDIMRKVTLAGKTVALPVYRIRLDQLYYNEHNDRIATWFGQFVAENKDANIVDLDREEFNQIIEGFIIQSNPVAIDKTEINIELVNQREPGVVLADGRIIDGNRRFTCLRRLSKKNDRFNWFEGIILDDDFSKDRRNIKMLELSIQHGEEKKVDYNPIDRVVGLYRDVIEDELLTVNQYALITNETVYEVRQKLQLAIFLKEFLEFINAPNQYHIAREQQVMTILNDMQDLLKRVETDELKEITKKIVFTNVAMKTVGNGRKYISELKAMISNGLFHAYVKEQEKLLGVFQDTIKETPITSKLELDNIIRNNRDLADDLLISKDKSLLQARRKETKSKPAQIINKSMMMLRGVDTNIVSKLSDADREHLKNNLDRLSQIVDRFKETVDEENRDNPKQDKPAEITAEIAHVERSVRKYSIADSRTNIPPVKCLTCEKPISNLSIQVELEFYPANRYGAQAEYDVFFLNANHEIISDINRISIKESEVTKTKFVLKSSASSDATCFLGIRYSDDVEDTLQQIIPFTMAMSFHTGVDF